MTTKLPRDFAERDGTCPQTAQPWLSIGPLIAGGRYDYAGITFHSEDQTSCLCAE